MTKFLDYQQDLEDAFRLDCSEEDLKTDKEAKQCYKQIMKSHKQATRYHNFLCKNGFANKRSYEVKNNKFNDILGLGLILTAFITVLCCAVASLVFKFQHPDMTEMRLFLENPAPTIISIIALIGGWIGKALLK